MSWGLCCEWENLKHFLFQLSLNDIKLQISLICPFHLVISDSRQIILNFVINLNYWPNWKWNNCLFPGFWKDILEWVVSFLDIKYATSKHTSSPPPSIRKWLPSSQALHVNNPSIWSMETAAEGSVGKSSTSHTPTLLLTSQYNIFFNKIFISSIKYSSFNMASTLI